MVKLFKQQKITDGINIDENDFWDDIKIFSNTDEDIESFKAELLNHDLDIKNIKAYNCFNGEKYVYIYKNTPIKLHVLNKPNEIIIYILKAIEDINTENIIKHIPSYLIDDYLNINDITSDKDIIHN